MTASNTLTRSIRLDGTSPEQGNNKSNVESIQLRMHSDLAVNREGIDIRK